MWTVIRKRWFPVLRVFKNFYLWWSDIDLENAAFVDHCPRDILWNHGFSRSTLVYPSVPIPIFCSRYSYFGQWSTHDILWMLVEISYLLVGSPVWRLNSWYIFCLDFVDQLIPFVGDFMRFPKAWSHHSCCCQNFTSPFQAIVGGGTGSAAEPCGCRCRRWRPAFLAGWSHSPHDHQTMGWNHETWIIWGPLSIMPFSGANEHPFFYPMCCMADLGGQ